MRKLVLTGCLAGVCFLTGCAARTPRIPLNTAKARASTSVPRPGTYIDLQPQWRLRVVTPILKSGGYVLGTLGTETDGKTVTVDTGGDFLGYEIAYYAVKPRRGGGVRIDFTAAEATRNGVTAPQTKSIAPLFNLPRGARYVRLVYLIRASQVDHDMGVVAARDMARLNALTLRAQGDPGSACHDSRDSRDGFCSWVPQGIAVSPEVERTAGGVTTWGPAR
ncbi:MAG: hypothetical protein ACRD4E_10975 [Bryobacteraceae bacterium]